MGLYSVPSSLADRWHIDAIAVIFYLINLDLHFLRVMTIRDIRVHWKKNKLEKLKSKVKLTIDVDLLN